MSLDVYLAMPGAVEPEHDREQIFVRRDGRTVEVTRAEWDEMYPGREPATFVGSDADGGVYAANITHNMGRMAAQCGKLYEALWRPEELGATRAAQLVEPLRDGLAILNSDRERLLEFNPENGWGNYDVLVEFTVDYLAACERWPEAEVSVSR